MTVEQHVPSKRHDTITNIVYQYACLCIDSAENWTLVGGIGALVSTPLTITP